MRQKRFFCYFLILLASILIPYNSCKKDKIISEEEQMTQREQKIIDKIEVFMPKQIGEMYKNQFTRLHGSSHYSLYLDSIELAIDELKSTIQLNYNLNDFQKSLNTTLQYFESSTKGSSTDCLGLGYAKGVSIDVGVAGKAGSGIVAGLQAAGGGGVKTIYDFINLERQVYYYTYCSGGFTFGIGAGAALKGSLGFTGINELITGIRYHGSSIVQNRFEGPGLSSSYSLSSDLATFFGVNFTLGIGTSCGAVADLNGIGNLLPCPQNMVAIENGTKGYSFKVSGSLSVGAQTEIALAFSNNTVGINSHGAPYTFKKFAENRALGGTRMATEILLIGPMPGIISPTVSFDLAASTVAIVYGLKDFSACPAVIPCIGTQGINSITGNSAVSGGIVTDDGGSSVTARGVVWNTSEVPAINSNTGISSDGQGVGEFVSNITGLTPNTKYYIRAYATNNEGTAYGKQSSFKTAFSAPTGKISGIIRDAGTALPLANVLLNVSLSNTTIITGLSQSDGRYEINIPENSGYKVLFSKQGYLSAEYQNVNVTVGGNTILEPVLQIDMTYSGSGNISGTIKNALDGTGVPNVLLHLRKGINVTSGEIIMVTTSGTSGEYLFNDISAGNYTVEASNSNFNTSYFTVICLGGQTTYGQDATLSAILASGETRIVLTWGVLPSDLDSHLTGPLADGSRFHMYYPDSENNYGSPWPDIVTLDLDDVSSYGPETTTLIQQIEGIYRFSVHDFTDRELIESYDLSNSGAQVKVYQSSGFVTTFNIPPNTGGTLWTVFEMSNGIISPVNQLSYESSPGNVTKGGYTNPETSLFKNLPKK